MRWETVEQILKVISVTAQSFNQGDRIDYSYQHAVNRVSKEYNIAYQTVGDACRRRLGLDHVDDFKAMLKAALEGDSTELRNLILGVTPPSYHNRVDEFFSNLKNGAVITKAPTPDTFLDYTIQLRKSDSDILRALAELLGGKPEEILADLAVGAIKDRMKKVVNQL